MTDQLLIWLFGYHSACRELKRQWTITRVLSDKLLQRSNRKNGNLDLSLSYHNVFHSVYLHVAAVHTSMQPYFAGFRVSRIPSCRPTHGKTGLYQYPDKMKAKTKDGYDLNIFQNMAPCGFGTQNGTTPEVPIGLNGWQWLEQVTGAELFLHCRDNSLRLVNAEYSRSLYSARDKFKNLLAILRYLLT